MQVSLWLELTPRCNLSCAFCYNPWRNAAKTEYPRELRDEDYFGVVNRLAERYRFSYVALSGGEPLLYTRLRALVALLTVADQPTILTTNGRLLTSAKVRDLAGAGLGGLQVSLLGAKPETHDRLAGRQSWKQAIRALALGLQGGLSTSATFIATSSNVAELPAVAVLLREIGIGHLVVNEMHPEGAAREHPELAPDPARMRLELAQARREVAGAGMNVSFVSATVDDAAPSSSQQGWGRVALSPDGQLKLCNQSETGFGPLQDLADWQLDSIIRDVTSGAVARYFRRIDHCRCFERFQESASAISRPSRRGFLRWGEAHPDTPARPQLDGLHS